MTSIPGNPHAEAAQPIYSSHQTHEQVQEDIYALMGVISNELSNDGASYLTVPMDNGLRHIPMSRISYIDVLPEDIEALRREEGHGTDA